MSRLPSISRAQLLDLIVEALEIHPLAARVCGFELPETISEITTKPLGQSIDPGKPMGQKIDHGVGTGSHQSASSAPAGAATGSDVPFRRWLGGARRPAAGPAGYESAIDYP